MLFSSASLQAQSGEKQPAPHPLGRLRLPNRLHVRAVRDRGVCAPLPPRTRRWLPLRPARREDLRKASHRLAHTDGRGQQARPTRRRNPEVPRHHQSATSKRVGWRPAHTFTERHPGSGAPSTANHLSVPCTLSPFSCILHCPSAPNARGPHAPLYAHTFTDLSDGRFIQLELPERFGAGHRLAAQRSRQRSVEHVPIVFRGGGRLRGLLVVLAFGLGIRRRWAVGGWRRRAPCGRPLSSSFSGRERVGPRVGPRGVRSTPTRSCPAAWSSRRARAPTPRRARESVRGSRRSAPAAGAPDAPSSPARSAPAEG